MSAYHKLHRYQLVKPITGDKIYQTSDIRQAIKKCYRELKHSSNKKHNSFSIMDIDTRDIYNFKRGTQNGGEVDSRNIDDENEQINESRAIEIVTNVDENANANIESTQNESSTQSQNGINNEIVEKILVLQETVNVLQDKVDELEKKIAVQTEITAPNSGITNDIDNANYSLKQLGLSEASTFKPRDILRKQQMTDTMEKNISNDWCVIC